MNNVKRNICILTSFVLIVGALTGCGKKSEPVKLTDTLNQIQGMDDYAPSGGLSKAFSENVVYEVTNVSWNGESGVAEVKVTTPDLGQIISDAIQVAVSEQDVVNYDALLGCVKENIQSVLSSEDYPILERTVEMDATKTDDGYTLISNDEFERIVSGNLEEIFLQALMEGLTNENAN